MSRGEEWSGVVQKALLKSEWDAEHPPMNLPEESVPDCVCVCVCFSQDESISPLYACQYSLVVYGSLCGFEDSGSFLSLLLHCVYCPCSAPDRQPCG